MVNSMKKESPELRSRIMSCVHSKNTLPEIVVRRLLHKMGFRFRLHRKDLPGKPDIVIPKYSTVINVNGCFWHMHTCKSGKSKPRNNADYWQKKRDGNRIRDNLNKKKLMEMGWEVIDVWECELKDLNKLKNKLSKIFDNVSNN